VGLTLLRHLLTGPSVKVEVEKVLGTLCINKGMKKAIKGIFQKKLSKKL
jgi:hypothetical protein